MQAEEVAIALEISQTPSEVIIRVIQQVCKIFSSGFTSQPGGEILLWNPYNTTLGLFRLQAMPMFFSVPRSKGF